MLIREIELHLSVWWMETSALNVMLTSQGSRLQSMAVFAEISGAEKL